MKGKGIIDTKQGKLVVERTRQDKKMSFMEVTKDKSNREVGEVTEEIRKKFRKKVKC